MIFMGAVMYRLIGSGEAGDAGTDDDDVAAERAFKPRRFRRDLDLHPERGRAFGAYAGHINRPL
jgi:hypothetical protein